MANTKPAKMFSVTPLYRPKMYPQMYLEQNSFDYKFKKTLYNDYSAAKLN